MPVPAATNCWTKAEAALATALSNSAAYQALTGTGDAAAALAKISGEELAWPADGEAFSAAELAAKPVKTLVGSTEAEPYSVTRSESNRFEPAGNIVIIIERLVAEATIAAASGPQELEVQFKNTIGDIIDEVMTYCANYGPWVRRMRPESGPGWAPRKHWPSLGRLQGVSITVEWGLVQ
jgi:hypothetical protein